MVKMYEKDDCRGGISPVKATEEMTQPVGQRDGQLYTAPSALPKVTAADDGKVMVVANGVWTAAAFPAASGGAF